MYRLSKKVFGREDLSTVIFEGSLGFKINDICYVPDDDKIVFSVKEENQLGVFEGRQMKYPWCEGMEKIIVKPSSITYKCGCIYMVCDNGRGFASLELVNRSLRKFLDKRSLELADNIFSKVNSEVKTDIYVEAVNKFYCVCDLISRCFTIEDGGLLTPLIGNGKSLYSNSNDLKACSLNRPSGISGGKNSVFISDSGNYCIRMLKDRKLITVVGTPQVSGDEDGNGLTAKLISPSQIVWNDGRLFFIDGKNKIKSFLFSDKKHNVSTQYESDGEIVAIEPAKKRELIILEKL